MEMTLNYSGAFCELGQNELAFVNGGTSGWAVAAIIAGTVVLCWCPVIAVGAFSYGLAGAELIGFMATVSGTAISCTAAGLLKAGYN